MQVGAVPTLLTAQRVVPKDIKYVLAGWACDGFWNEWHAQQPFDGQAEVLGEHFSACMDIGGGPAERSWSLGGTSYEDGLHHGEKRKSVQGVLVLLAGEPSL